MTYIPGDFYRNCDVCGFRYRASETRLRWDNQMVCAEDWEPQHPQDFVRGRKDNQTVPYPRPEPTMTFIGTLNTTLTAAAAAGATTLNVASSVRYEGGDDIGIMLADGNTFRTQINSVVSELQITIVPGLSGAAMSGALVVNYDAVAEDDIG